MKSQRTLSFSGALGVWAAICFAAALYGTWQGAGGRRYAFALILFGVYLAGPLLLAADNLCERVAAWLATRTFAVAVPLIPLLLYLVYVAAAGTWSLRGIALATGYVGLPWLAALSARAKNKPPGAWEDYVPIVLIGISALLPVPRELWPGLSPRLFSMLGSLLAMNIALLNLVLLRRIDGVGYSLSWKGSWSWTIGAGFVLILVVCLPLGQALGFIRFDPSLVKLKTLPLLISWMFFFNSWPQEFFFRGLLQNLTSRALGNAEVGWLLSSLLFGLAHFGVFAFPNWRFALLATVAGLVYGKIWQRTGSIVPSTVLHALVNVCWISLFRWG